MLHERVLSRRCQYLLASTGSAQRAPTRCCSTCFFLWHFVSPSIRHWAPHLGVNISQFNAQINPPPPVFFQRRTQALSWCLILIGSSRRPPIVRSHDNPPAKVRRWMVFKGLQETWVRPPCLLVSPAPSEKTLSVSPCQSSVRCRQRSGPTCLRRESSLLLSDEISPHLVQSCFCHELSKDCVAPI